MGNKSLIKRAGKFSKWDEGIYDGTVESAVRCTLVVLASCPVACIAIWGRLNPSFGRLPRHMGYDEDYPPPLSEIP